MKNHVTGKVFLLLLKSMNKKGLEKSEVSKNILFPILSLWKGSVCLIWKIFSILITRTEYQPHSWLPFLFRNIIVLHLPNKVLILNFNENCLQTKFRFWFICRTFFCDEDSSQILVFNIWRGSLSQKVCSFKNVLRQSLLHLFEERNTRN